MELMNQPFSGQLGNRLIELLESKNYHTLNIAVAFAKNSGVLRIKSALETFRAQGGEVNIFVGVDLGGTSYEALTALRQLASSLNVVHSETGQTFHSKIYQFLGKNSGLIVVGSHNLTGGGLWTNIESSMHIPIDRSRIEEKALVKGLDDYVQELQSIDASFMEIKSQDDIETLLLNEYVAKEVTEQVRRAKAAKQAGSRKRLFGNGVPAKLPRLTPKKKKKGPAVAAPTKKSATLLPKDDNQTIWFETKKLTGGSRNILDLSKKSLIEHGDPSGTPFDLGEPNFMRGGVEFFGLDPADTSKTKNIILNFDGTDYAGNTVLFPSGDKANGTWRLQIKGTDVANRRITEAFTDKSATPYLVQKIVTFTKIRDDYYFLSVFPETELTNFKTASRILARNGRTKSAKLLGLL